MISLPARTPPLSAETISQAPDNHWAQTISQASVGGPVVPGEIEPEEMVWHGYDGDEMGTGKLSSSDDDGSGSEWSPQHRPGGGESSHGADDTCSTVVRWVHCLMPWDAGGPGRIFTPRASGQSDDRRQVSRLQSQTRALTFDSCQPSPVDSRCQRCPQQAADWDQALPDRVHPSRSAKKLPGESRGFQNWAAELVPTEPVCSKHPSFGAHFLLL